MIASGMKELERFKKEHPIAEPTAAELADSICHQAWNDMYHKCRPEISYESFKYIWQMCIERAAPSPTEQASDVLSEEIGYVDQIVNGEPVIQWTNVAPIKPGNKIYAAISTAAEQASDVRNAALEEAAAICDEYNECWYVYRKGARDCAHAIRTRAIGESCKPDTPADKGNAPAEQKEGMPVSQEPKYGIRDNRLYNRATGEFIPLDEPVFIFRARDMKGKKHIAAYADDCQSVDIEHYRAVAQRVADFSLFELKHPERMKYPDTATKDQA